MSIPLGRSLTDPSFVFSQILVTVAIYFIILGGMAYLLSVLSFLFFSPSSESQTTTALWQRMRADVHIPLSSLFRAQHISSPSTSAAVAVGDDEIVTIADELRFFTLHLFTSLCASYPIAAIIQRRKFALDFSFTITVVYVMTSIIVIRRLPLCVWWWISVSTSFAVMWALTHYFCKRWELQGIDTSTGGGGGGAGGSSNAAIVTVGSPQGVSSPGAGVGVSGGVGVASVASRESVPLLVAERLPAAGRAAGSRGFFDRGDGGGVAQDVPMATVAAAKRAV